MNKHYTPLRIVFYVLLTRFVNSLKRASKWLFIGALLIASVACEVSAASTANTIASTAAPAVNTAAPLPTAQPSGVVCMSGGLNVRSCSRTDCAPVGILPDDTRVQITGKPRFPEAGGKWVQIKAGDISGWVNSRYICEVVQ